MLPLCGVLAVVRDQGHVLSEAEGLHALVSNGFMWHSHPDLSNFVTWSGQGLALCTMMKVGSTTLDALGFFKMSKSTATHALLDPDTVRAIVVRNPVDRFLSWHNDKIVHGTAEQVGAYNSLLLRSHATTRHTALVYADAIRRRPRQAWDLEYHLSPMSRMCHLNILEYDVVGDLDNLSSFWKALRALNVSLPPGIRNESRMNEKGHIGANDIGCSLHEALSDIYRQDIRRLQKLAMKHAKLLLHLQRGFADSNCTTA